MGFIPDLFAGEASILADPTGRKWYDLIQTGRGDAAAMQIIVAFSHNTFPEGPMYFPGAQGYKSAWQTTIDAAGQFNDPGTFTAFIGHEWTSNAGGNNPHRTVIYRDGADRANSFSPLRSIRRSAATIPRSSGNGWRCTRRRRAAACQLSPITAITRMA